MRGPLRSPWGSLPLALLLAGCAATASSGGITRTYFLAADEVDWDYTPTDSNLITGSAWSEFDKFVVARGPDRVGHIYKKAVYHEYTDSTFTTQKPRTPEWEHLGLSLIHI